MSEEGDEVKVFRRADDEETETSAPSLAADKKEVAMEEELDSKEQIIGGKGAFSRPQPSPSFNPLLYGSPTYGYPFLPIIMNPSMAYMQRQMSPSFPLMPPMALSPMADLYRIAQLTAGPCSPLAGPKMGGIPLPPSMRPHPLNQINHMSLPSFMGASMAQMASHLATPKRSREKQDKEKHIKKPMNAFMWFMKENRPKLMEELEYKEKQSAELNKELGRRWQTLGKEEQQKYYDMAKQDKDDHKKKYPGWTARENYAIHKKNKKKKKDKTVENSDSKKCRARFGTSQQHLWCKCCKRKKKCEYADSVGDERSTAGGAPSDSESEFEEPMLTDRDLHEVTHQ